jgi:hypothetical protein
MLGLISQITLRQNLSRVLTIPEADNNLINIVAAIEDMGLDITDLYAAFAAFTTINMVQANRITTNLTIPNGVNAVMLGAFEVSPDVTVTGEGNSTWAGLQ